MVSDYSKALQSFIKNPKEYNKIISDSMPSRGYVGLCNSAFRSLYILLNSNSSLCNPNTTIYSVLSAVIFCLVNPNPNPMFY
jgi:hypothetical protein